MKTTGGRGRPPPRAPAMQCALRERPRPGALVVLGRRAEDALAADREKPEALDPAAFLAERRREARQAVARQRAARGGLLGRDHDRRDEAERLDLGEDVAPRRAGADGDALVLADVQDLADRVEALERDDDVRPERLRVERV